jgi:type IV pilus assembly protein PilX
MKYPRPNIYYRRKSQRGMSLFTVLVMLLLSLTAVLGAFRVSTLNESILGNSSDYNRTYAAAEALIRDAEIDIRGRTPPYTAQLDGTLGLPCRPVAPGSLLVQAGFIGCRNQVPGPWIPNSDEFDTVGDMVAASHPSRCMQGLCFPINSTDLANIETNVVAMIPRGATYGQFTRVGLAAPAAAGNPILSGAQPRGWYWIEAFRYSTTPSSGASIAVDVVPHLSNSIVYRITAIAQGLKPGTQVVLKSVFVPTPSSQNP